MRTLFLLLLGSTSCSASAQDTWSWGWSPPDTTWAEDALLHTISQPSDSFGETAIGFYQQSVAPRMGRPCPAWPSCSMYTRYAIARWGLIRGTLMGVDRIFFRENAGFVDGETAFTFVLDHRTRVYDPPETNVARHLHDWRLLHPQYRGLHDIAGSNTVGRAGSRSNTHRLGVHVATDD